MDEHYERLRNRALEALDDNQNGTISDDDLIYALENNLWASGAEPRGGTR